MDNYTPNNTYRLQFHKAFNFKHFEEIIDYLRQLGIDTIYASPILRAAPDSAHGYDVTDPSQINPELGTKSQLAKLKQRLRQHHMKWLQDIVPNHMAFHPDNIWLMDVLEYGEASRYSSYFDTACNIPPFKKERIMVPILGKELEEAVSSGEIALLADDARWYIRYFDYKLPLSPESYLYILKKNKKLADLPLEDLATQINNIYDRGTTEWESFREKIFVVLTSSANRNEFKRGISRINKSKKSISDILSLQHYRLCYWKETDHKINYRRFFTVNSLICLNIHRDEVLKDVHRLTLELLNEEIIDGLRIDHIDGLYNPAKYLRDLRSLCGAETYIVVEKILEHDEQLPTKWPIQGTTGYEFLALCNNVCTDRNSKKALTSYYKQLTGNNAPLEKQQLDKKGIILARHMQGEIDNLCHLYEQLQLHKDQPVQPKKMREAIQAFLTYFPMYRLYEEHFPFSDEAYGTIVSIFDIMSENTDRSDHKGIQALRQVFEYAQRHDDASYRERAVTFFLRCMQFSGPVMAKGVEDTLMYTYNRFIGHNEVGDHPHNFGISVQEFHRRMSQRQAYWPTSLNATATHDTKRGEDARCRLQVISAWPELWTKHVDRWQRIVSQEYQEQLPHINDIYFIYQTLYACHPMPDTSEEGFEERLHAYLVKALREGKERSQWAAPDEAYEQLVRDFVHFLLDKEGSFFADFRSFLKKTADFGIMNSLAQLTLKFTCPGVPDTYQGTELWDLSFVDPDNRRKVDYVLRKNYLEEIERLPTDKRIPTLWAERYNGKIKLWLLKTLLAVRRECSELFRHGEYIKLKVKGKYRDHVLAFARRDQQDWVVVAVPLHLAAIDKMRREDGSFDWEDTRITLPTEQHLEWHDLLADGRGQGTQLMLADIFARLPLAIIRFQEPVKPRSAGILMHITSLPSAFGIGDLGRPAVQFVHHLYESGQRWWQVLPLGPTSRQQCYSPYSTLSAMAGNPLLISLEALADQGLLTEEERKEGKFRSSPYIDYHAVESTKTKLLYRAFERAAPEETVAFQQFCQQEAHWLSDYALFAVLRQQHADAPWYSWDPTFRTRDPKALAAFREAHRTAILREQWIQYIFFQQWFALRQYCQHMGIRLLGDVPIYVSHDSADVWANPDLFSLRKNGTLKTMAGVPPDYFNTEGQLWGMPVFNWSLLKKQGYSWWIDRLTQSCKLFDKVRLDHFRAFAAYWEVPANETTAKNGKWKTGPGTDFFNTVRARLGDMPFVAEDLGDIDDTVYALRDAYGLPGMKVLQFAFGDDMPVSQNIPHNYERNFFVYTGTHDNNTVLGWFSDEIGDATKHRLCRYAGLAVHEGNVAETLIRMAYASVADTAIIPMQDILKLDGKHRMNRPATTSGNWSWRMAKGAFDKEIRRKLLEETVHYGR